MLKQFFSEFGSVFSPDGAKKPTRWTKIGLVATSKESDGITYRLVAILEKLER